MPEGSRNVIVTWMMTSTPESALELYAAAAPPPSPPLTEPAALCKERHQVSSSRGSSARRGCSTPSSSSRHCTRCRRRTSSISKTPRGPLTPLRVHRKINPFLAFMWRWGARLCASKNIAERAAKQAQRFLLRDGDRTRRGGVSGLNRHLIQRTAIIVYKPIRKHSE
jgi:hypothetical protein